MKLALSMIALLVTAHLAHAKGRYLVTFKSEQGFKAMESYYLTESGNPSVQIQKSLRQIHAVVLKSKNDLTATLVNHPEVASVEAEFFIPSPKPVNGFKISRVQRRLESMTSNFDQSASTDSSTATPVFNAGASTPWGILAVKAGEAWSLSAAGANARVLVLDTGVDQDHPAIKANFEKGQNFTEDTQGAVDPKDYADTEGHGTHCSGTILGAYNSETGFTGVAPKAKLLMGKVCSSLGCSNIAVAEGIDWGIQEKVDVISMSLGSPIGASAESTAVQNAERAGVVVVAASGNSATEPTYSYDKKDPKCRSTNPFQPTMCGVSFPAAFPTVVAVGALDSTLKKTNFSQWGPELDITAPGAAVISSVPRGTGRESKVLLSLGGQQKEIKSSAFSGTKLFESAVSNEIVVVPGTGQDTDFSKVNVVGKFALVRRGEIKFAQKVQNAIAAKAAGVLIYNNTAGLMQGSLSEDGTLIDLPVVMIEQTEGQNLVDQLTKGAVASAAISTLPADYAAFDGTSMATPHVAGVVALIKSANKNLKPAQVRQILSTTAMVLSPNDTNQFGAGIVQADKAVQAAVKTVVE